MNEVTVELTNVTGVTKDNIDAVVSRIEEMACQGDFAAYFEDKDIWVPSLEEQKKQFDEKDEITLFFLMARK
jgi:hypothetical protein